MDANANSDVQRAEEFKFKANDAFKGMLGLDLVLLCS